MKAVAIFIGIGLCFVQLSTAHAEDTTMSVEGFVLVTYQGVQAGGPISLDVDKDVDSAMNFFLVSLYETVIIIQEKSSDGDKKKDPRISMAFSGAYQGIAINITVEGESIFSVARKMQALLLSEVVKIKEVDVEKEQETSI